MRLCAGSRQRTGIKTVRSRKTILALNLVFDHREARGGEPPLGGENTKIANKRANLDSSMASTQQLQYHRSAHKGHTHRLRPRNDARAAVYNPR
eukprot:1545418-Prymnesium_polylepis.1